MKRSTAVLLAACLVICNWPTTLSAATPQTPAVSKHHVEFLGVGAVVEVRLATGEKFRGSISAIDTENFDVLSTRERGARRIAYDQVTELKFAKSKYRSSGAPNVQEVRRVVAGLGVGEHVAAKVASATTFRGHIQASDEARFVILPDGQSTPVEIAYSDVQALGPNPSTAVIIAITAAVTVLGVMIIAALAQGI